MSKAPGRAQTRYVCQSCGESFLRWEGQCRACSAWNSLVETVIRADPRPSRPHPTNALGGTAEATRLADVEPGEQDRIAVGIAELDRVLGGGLVPGSVVLVGGEPGIGKSTLLLQAAAGVAAAFGGDRVVYATGEESAAQVRLRAERLGLLNGPAAEMRVAAESSIDRLAELATSAPAPVLLVVDSVQTATVDELDGPAGSVGQVRGAALRLMEVAKPSGIAVVLVGHVTKDGTIAGPKTLEHLVDAVLTLEGERFAGLRLLRASKNRFGSTEEVGVFEMGAAGLAELDDPARAFLSGGPGGGGSRADG
ncbi:MAG TPA: AAA family ATPase, partial [Candidatus Limnocylindrales bacterium]|nr:AAA family ATPase [Candidatus Limnocylindrales bacterium]